MKIKLIKNLCCMNNNLLRNYLIQTLSSFGYKNIISNDFYTIAEGTIPICLIAHIDTVFNNPPKINDFIFDNKKQILWVPGGAGFDDRAGIWCIIELLKAGFCPHVIFTNYEELKGIGSKQLIKDFSNIPFKDCKALIELDRANEKDMVFYNCDNENFEEYISQYGFVAKKGTFTDISIIAPAWNIAAVNLSVGYEDEHSGMERLNIKWFENTLHRVSILLYDINKMPFFKYIPLITTKECLICGNKNNLIFVNEEEFQFYLCKTCYNQCYGHL